MSLHPAICPLAVYKARADRRDRWQGIRGFASLKDAGRDGTFPKFPPLVHVLGTLRWFGCGPPSDPAA